MKTQCDGTRRAQDINQLNRLPNSPRSMRRREVVMKTSLGRRINLRRAHLSQNHPARRSPKRRRQKRQRSLKVHLRRTKSKILPQSHLHRSLKQIPVLRRAALKARRRAARLRRRPLSRAKARSVPKGHARALVLLERGRQMVTVTTMRRQRRRSRSLRVSLVVG